VIRSRAMIWLAIGAMWLGLSALTLAVCVAGKREDERECRELKSAKSAYIQTGRRGKSIECSRRSAATERRRSCVR
jgi:hypothetical protein